MMNNDEIDKLARALPRRTMRGERIPTATTMALACRLGEVLGQVETLGEMGEKVAESYRAEMRITAGLRKVIVERDGEVAELEEPQVGIVRCPHCDQEHDVSLSRGRTNDPNERGEGEHPGTLLRLSRTERGVSLRAAAKILDVSNVELGNVERGATDWEDAAAMWVRWQRLGGDEPKEQSP